MKRIDKDHIELHIMPGVADWLEYQKDPDGLVNKLVIDYRQASRDPGFRWFQNACMVFCVLVIGTMAGYAWDRYHMNQQPPEQVYIMVPDIAVDLTKNMPPTPGGNRYAK